MTTLELLEAEQELAAKQSRPTLLMLGNLTEVTCKCGETEHYIINERGTAETKTSLEEILLKHHKNQLRLEVGLDLDEFPGLDLADFEGDEEKLPYKFTLIGKVRYESCQHCNESWPSMEDLGNYIFLHFFSSDEEDDESFSDPEENPLLVRVVVTVLN